MSVKKAGKVLYWVVVFAVSACVFWIYLSISGSWNFEPASFPKMLEGTADRPYVYRLLIPVISKFTAWLIPSWLIDVSQKAPYSIKYIINVLGQGKYLREAIVAVILMYFSLVGFIFTERSLLKYLEYSPEAEQIIPIVLSIFILPLTLFHGYIYDLPQLFLFTLGLVFLLRKQWHFYLPLLALVTANKETSIFLIVIFALYYFQSLNRKAYFLLLGAQLMVYVLIHGLTLYLYRNNPGNVLLWTGGLQLSEYIHYPITFLVTILFFGIILFLVFKDWQYKPFFLRISFSVFFMILVLFFVGGREMEFRVFIDILPIFGTLMFPYTKSV